MIHKARSARNGVRSPFLGLRRGPTECGHVFVWSPRNSFSFSFGRAVRFLKRSGKARRLGSAWVGWVVGGSGMWSRGGAKKWGGPGFDQKNTPVPPFDSAKRRRRETRIREALRLYESTNSTNGIIFYIDVFLAIHF
jgi:hypothetical protein